MASSEEAAHDVATWRTVLLLLLILIISISWEFLNEQVEFWLRKIGHPGLKTAWDRLKFEVLTLGVISLLLVVFEDKLVKICIPKKKSSYSSYYYPPPAVAAEEATHRRLLASTENPCPEGKESLWPGTLIHKMHILIFLISINHIFYACVSFVVCRWSVRHWHTWENEALSEGGSMLKPLDKTYLQRKGEARWYYKLRASLRQFSHRLDRPTFLALRRLRIERLTLLDTYGFTAEMFNALELEFSDIFKTEFFVWAIAIVFVVVPARTNFDLWLSIAFLGASIIVGGKLHVIVTKLAQHAHSMYKDELTPYQRELKRSKVIRRRSTGGPGHSMSKASLSIAKAPFAAMTKLGTSIKEQFQKAGNSLMLSEASESGSSRPRSLRPSLSRHSAPMSYNSRRGSMADAAARALAEVSELGGALPPTFDHQESNSPRLPVVEEHPSHTLALTHMSSVETRTLSAELTTVAHAVGEGVSFGVDSQELWPDTNSAAASSPSCTRIEMQSGSNQAHESRVRAAWNAERGAHSSGSGWTADDESDGLSSGDLSGVEWEGGPVAEHTEPENGGHSIGMVPSFGPPSLLVQEAAKLDSDTQASAPACVPRPSQESVFDTTKLPEACVNHHVAALVGDDAVRQGCCHNAPKMFQGVSSTVLGKENAGYEEYTLKGDFQSLFWFSRPGLCLKVFQYSYFKNALTLAIIWFAFWQHEHEMFSGAVVTKGKPGLIVITCVLVFFDMLLLIHGAVYVLPVYVLAKAMAEAKEQYWNKAQKLGGDLAEKANQLQQAQAVLFSGKDSSHLPGTLSPREATDSLSDIEGSIASPAAKSPFRALSLARRSVPELSRKSGADSTASPSAQPTPTIRPNLARLSAPKLGRRSMPDPLLGRMLSRNSAKAYQEAEAIDRVLTGMQQKLETDIASLVSSPAKASDSAGAPGKE